MILAVGEALAEFMRTTPGADWTAPGDLRGPFPSGAPAIFASVAARLGASTALCSVVGGDPFGTLIRRRLEHDGVELSGLRTDPAANTACAFVAYAPDGSRQFVFLLRDSAAARLTVADLDDLPERAAWLHVSGATLALSDAMALVAERAVERAAAAGARVSLDPNLRPEALSPDIAARIRRLAASADVLFPSDGELGALGLPADAAPIVCTTLGARGIDVALGDRHELVPAVAARERDPTGAGDTFAAAFVVATLRGAEPVEAARAGAELAAVAVEHVGGMEAPVMGRCASILQA